MKKALMFSVLTAGILVLTGCSSDDGDGGTSTNTTQSAQFIDSAVAGLSYECQSSGNGGLTDANGYFNYVTGDTCTFSIGETVLGSAQITGTTTPRTLTTVEPDLSNILRLLQTLDTDADPENGIVLPTALTGSIDLGSDFDAQIDSYLAQNHISNPVVSAVVANEHFRTSVPLTIEDADFSEKSYTFINAYVDSTITFNADHTYAYASGSTGTWSVAENTLVLVDALHLGAIEFIFISETKCVGKSYYISGSDQSHIGEQVIRDIRYTTSDGSSISDSTSAAWDDGSSTGGSAGDDSADESTGGTTDDGSSDGSTDSGSSDGTTDNGSTGGSVTTPVDPTPTAGTLIVNTALPNMLVALHDTETMEVLEEKYSDASGRVTFDVPTPRASFSVSLTPDLVVGKGFIFEYTRSIIIDGTFRACEGDPSVDSHCSSTDWCALSTFDSIPNWTLEALTGDNNASAAFDTNNDGKIDEDEIYQFSLTEKDTNSDQVITYSEWESNDNPTVKTQLVTSTPVREYTISLADNLVRETDTDFCGTATNGFSLVDINITVTDLDASLNYVFGVMGSTREDINTEAQDSATIHTDYLFKDNNGNYVFLLMAGVQDDGSTIKTFYYETTPEALEQNKSISFSAFTSNDLKPVTSDNPDTLGIMAYHDKLRLDINLGDGYRGIFTHPNLNYVLAGGVGNTYSSTGFGYFNSHWNYYGDGTLKDNYYAANYPLLDISVAKAASGGIDFSGADLSKINLSTYDLELRTDTYNFELSITSTTANYSRFDLNLSKVLPGSITSYLTNFDQNVQNSNYSRKDDFILQEIKDMNEDEIIAYYMQNSGLNLSTLINGDLLPRREFKTSLIDAGAVHMSPSRTQNIDKSSTNFHPYTLKFETKEFWH